jgi:hypothetical protein
MLEDATPRMQAERLAVRRQLDEHDQSANR